MTKEHERQSFWTGYYARQRTTALPAVPSQFAAFVVQELPRDVTIIDFGCGNARDSLFFATYGFDVLGIDASPEAVGLGRDKARAMGLGNAHFLVGDVGGDSVYDHLGSLSQRRLCVYARFFLHAITQAEQDHFLQSLTAILKPGDMMAFEYRTTRDADVKKVADPNYRRFQKAADLNQTLSDCGFSQLYANEGTGLAKYKTEDAVVARCIVEKTKQAVMSLKHVA